MKIINTSALDGVELNGLLYNEGTDTKDIIISVHGMTSCCFKNRDKVIANKVNKNNIDYFCFNNRGSDLMKYIEVNVNGEPQSRLGGTSFEDVLEGYEDIVGAINAMKNLGYENIYLQGHSLGCTKVVYAYNRLLEENNIEILSHIRGIILLSLIDIPTVMKYYMKDKEEYYINLAEEKMNCGKEYELMPSDCFIHPICAKTFLRYAKYNEDFNFINTVKDENLRVLNDINIPLFMRWGNVKEMILIEASQYADKIRGIIQNENADIDYIDGADHGYHGREEVLANQIMNFINKII